jgi:hypothetical protein
MSHIVEDIRIDALNFLDLWLKYFGNLLVPFSNQLLLNYVGMLSGNLLNPSAQTTKSVGTGNPSSALHNSAIRTKILFSLCNFLNLCRDAPTKDFGSLENQEIWGHDLFQCEKASSFSSMIFQPEECSTGFRLHDPYSVKKLVDSIAPSIVAFWVESAPIVFHTAKVAPSEGLDVCNASVKLLGTIFRFLSPDELQQDWKSTFQESTLRHLKGYFPCGQGAEIETQAQSQILEMNANLIELLSLFYPEEAETAFTYFIESFSNKKSGVLCMSVTQISALLFALESCLSMSGSDRLLKHLLTWCNTLPISSAFRATMTKFVIRHVMVCKISLHCNGPQLIRLNS